MSLATANRHYTKPNAGLPGVDLARVVRRLLRTRSPPERVIWASTPIPIHAFANLGSAFDGVARRWRAW